MNFIRKIPKTYFIFGLVLASVFAFWHFSDAAMIDGGPPPAPTPPTATITANGVHSLTVNAGDMVNFLWSSTDADSANSTYSVDSPDTCGSFPWPVGTGLSGSASLPALNCQKGHRYTIKYTASQIGDGSGSDSVTILVSDGSPPPIVGVSVSSAIFPVGQSATLSWGVANGYTSCTASWTASPSLPTGSQTISPPTPGIYYYTMTCQNGGGSGSQTQKVVVTSNNPNFRVGLNFYGVAVTVPANAGWSTQINNNYSPKQPHYVYLENSLFNVDFRVGLRGCNNGVDPCHIGWSPWASEIANGTTGGFNWSAPAAAGPYTGSQVSCGRTYSAAGAHNRLLNVWIAAETRPLPPGQTAISAQLLGGALEWDFGMAVDAPLCFGGDGTQGITPAGGGWSTGFADKWGNQSTDGLQVSIAASWQSATPNPPPPNPTLGTITVNSVNSKTGQPVVASWYFPAYASTDPCTLATCKATSSATYSPLPTGPYTIYAPYSNYPVPTDYVFNGVEKTTIVAERPPSIFERVLGWLGKIVHAVTFGGTCGSGNNSCSITATQSSIVFIVGWEPLSVIDTSPTTLTFSGTSGGPNPAAQTVNISNIGAPGSLMDFTSYTAGGALAGRITVSPGTLSGIAQGTSQPASVSVDTSGLATGTYPGTLTFNSVTEGVPPASGGTSQKTITVNLDLAAPPPSCSSFAANPSRVIPPNGSTLFWSCTYADTCSISPGIGIVSPPPPNMESTPVSGNVTAYPTSTTTYVLNCSGPGGNLAPPLSTIVTVQLPGRIEVAP